MSVFNHPKIVEANNQLQQKLTEYGGKMKLGFIQLQTGEPVPSPTSLTNLFAKMQIDILDMRREQIILGAAVRLMVEALAGKDESGAFAEGMAEAMVTDIAQQLARLDDMIAEKAKADIKPELKLPPGFSGRN